MTIRLSKSFNNYVHLIFDNSLEGLESCWEMIRKSEDEVEGMTAVSEELTIAGFVEEKKIYVEKINSTSEGDFQVPGTSSVTANSADYF